MVYVYIFFSIFKNRKTIKYRDDDPIKMKLMKLLILHVNYLEAIYKIFVGFKIYLCERHLCTNR